MFKDGYCQKVISLDLCDNTTPEDEAMQPPNLVHLLLDQTRHHWDLTAEEES